MRILEFNERIKDFVCGRQLVACDSPADGCELLCAGVQQIEVYHDVEMGFGADAGGYEVWAETGV